MLRLIGGVVVYGFALYGLAVFTGNQRTRGGRGTSHS